MTETTRQTIQRFIDEVINQQNLDAIDDLVHPAYELRSPDRQVRGRAALREFLSAYHEAFPDLRITINDLVCAADRAVLIFTLTASQQGDFMGLAATGRKISIDGMICSRVDNGRIIEEWELLDQLTLFRQLGLVAI